MGPGFYLHRILRGPEDGILECPLYRDYVEEYKYLNSLVDGECVVFVGDSIIARFKLSEYFDDKKILNRGIFSDTTYGLLQRMEENLANLHVAKCFIMIGYNDLKYRSNEEILLNYEKILEKLKGATRTY